MTGLRNCHAHGVDSVVLSTYPDGRPHVRMFVTRPDHTLWRNSALHGFASIAVHSHRADLMLKQIYGPVFNVRARVEKGGLEQDTFSSWAYESALLRRYAPGFSELGARFLSTKNEDMRGHKVVFMDAGELHTVFVPKGREAAWFVTENGLAETYKNVVYSNADLTTFSFDGMYEEMGNDEIEATLQDAMVRMGQHS